MQEKALAWEEHPFLPNLSILSAWPHLVTAARGLPAHPPSSFGPSSVLLQHLVFTSHGPAKHWLLGCIFCPTCRFPVAGQWFLSLILLCLTQCILVLTLQWMSLCPTYRYGWAEPGFGMCAHLLGKPFRKAGTDSQGKYKRKIPGGWGVGWREQL